MNGVSNQKYNIKNIIIIEVWLLREGQRPNPKTTVCFVASLFFVLQADKKREGEERRRIDPKTIEINFYLLTFSFFFSSHSSDCTIVIVIIRTKYCKRRNK